MKRSGSIHDAFLSVACRNATEPFMSECSAHVGVPRMSPPSLDPECAAPGNLRLHLASEFQPLPRGERQRQLCVGVHRDGEGRHPGGSWGVCVSSCRNDRPCEGPQMSGVLPNVDGAFPQSAFRDHLGPVKTGPRYAQDDNLGLKRMLGLGQGEPDECPIAG